MCQKPQLDRATACRRPARDRSKIRVVIDHEGVWLSHSGGEDGYEISTTGSCHGGADGHIGRVFDLCATRDPGTGTGRRRRTPGRPAPAYELLRDQHVEGPG